MSKKFTKIFSGLHFPAASALPSDAQAGDLTFHEGKLKICSGGQFKTIALGRETARFTINWTNAAVAVMLPPPDAADVYTVDWGDGTTTDKAAGNTTSASHTYAIAGVKTIVVRGTLWGTRTSYAFLFETNSVPADARPFVDALTAVTLQHTSHVTNFNGTFFARPLLVSASLPNTQAGLNFEAVFMYCRVLTTASLPTTQAGTNFVNMFHECNALTSLSLPHTEAGLNFEAMFLNCFALSSISLSPTSVGTNFKNMFYGSRSLVTASLPNTQAGLDFEAAFMLCSSLTTVSLPDTRAGTNFKNMFIGCNALTAISLPHTESGLNFGWMFLMTENVPSALVSVNMPTTGAGQIFEGTFINCYSLPSITLPHTESGTNFKYMFANNGGLPSALTSVNMPTTNNGGFPYFEGTFLNCNNLPKANINPQFMDLR